MNLATAFLVIISVVLVNNFIFSRFLGYCPYIGVSTEKKSALGMGLAVIFVMTLASVVCWLVYHFFLYPSESNLFYKIFGGNQGVENFDLRYLMTLVFILVIAALVQFVEMVIQKIAPPLYAALGIYLPLITTNCAVLGVTILNIEGVTINGTALGYGHPMSLLFGVLQGFGAGCGFLLALMLMAGIRERLALQNIPKPFRGMPIAFLTAALLAIAFMGFAGLVK
ncbi:electron transport complex subunit RsxA [bacterium]|nr:electron transport complex subunit RsxA [bacterium]